MFHALPSKPPPQQHAPRAQPPPHLPPTPAPSLEMQQLYLSQLIQMQQSLLAQQIQQGQHSLERLQQPARAPEPTPDDLAKNPLLASALARRKQREEVTALDFARLSLERSPGPRPGSPSSSTPSLVLSKPGDPYPTTASEGSDDGALVRRGSSEGSLNSDGSAGSFDADESGDTSRTSSLEAGADSPTVTLKKPDNSIGRGRPSQTLTLMAALGNRQRGMSSPAHDGAAEQQQAYGHQQDRSASDSFMSALSPLANTFSPIPSPSYAALANMYATYPAQMNFHSYPASPNPYPVSPNPYRSTSGSQFAAYGSASCIRQPIGPAPEAELSSVNFASRIRRQAIGNLGRIGRGRASLGGEA